MARTCQTVKKNGEPCASQVLADGTYCYMHAPGIDQQRTEARAKGGRSKANYRRLLKLAPSALGPVATRLEQAMAETHEGALDPKVASALAALARALVAVVTSGELEDRLRRLEERSA